MNTGELFILSRRLMKVAEDHLPKGPKGLSNTSTRLILIDVAGNSGTSINGIVARTGFPQSLVSSTVARLREIGVVDSRTDPADRRRTLVTITPMAEDRARNNPASAAPVERTLADAMPGANPHDVADVAAALELLARHLMPNLVDHRGPGRHKERSVMIASSLGGGGVALYVIAGLLVLRIGFAAYRHNQRPPSTPAGGSTITVGGAPTAAAPTAAGEVLLEVRHLSVAYGAKVAVDDANLQIRRGEIFGLLGPNGAGKTSTLSAIEGLLKPSKGDVLLDGVDTYRNQSATRARMGVALQSTAFQPELTVLQVARLYAGLYGVACPDEELAAGLTEAGLGHEMTRTFRQLSGGQQQRLALFVAVIHDPLLLLLDEPTAALDPQSRRHLWERLERIRSEGGCILLTTHSMEEAASVCDRVAIIDHGHVLAVDEPRALIDAHRDDPDVRAVARGDITLEDVFIGLTGREIRD